MEAAARQRFGLAAVMGLALWAGRLPAAAPARAVPTRPGTAVAAKAPAATLAPSTVRKRGRTEYVAVSEVARQLGLKLRWIEAGKKLTLSGPAVKAEIENDTRDLTINGLRVFLGDPVTDSGGQLYVSRVDFERCLTPLLRPGFGLPARPRPKTIVLDAGHGGSDPGKINTKFRINEKTFTLDVAGRTRKLLEAAGYRVVLTRSGDETVALSRRAAAANAARADVFVSIHFNALANDTKTSGVEVYTFAPRFQRSANAWGPMEKDDTEDEASPVNRFDHWSAMLAHAIHGRFVEDLKAADRGKKLMHLAVLRPLACPGVLIECGFLTSDAEARKIATPAYRQQLAVALAAGLRDYADALGAAGAGSARPPTMTPPRADAGR